MSKNLPWEKVNGRKHSTFFVSRSPTHHRLLFNLIFFYELKHKVLFPLIVGGIFHFYFDLFLLKCIYLLNKKHQLFDFKASQFLSKLY